jgi:hypothetical protein
MRGLYNSSFARLNFSVRMKSLTIYLLRHARKVRLGFSTGKELIK